MDSAITSLTEPEAGVIPVATSNGSARFATSAKLPKSQKGETVTVVRKITEMARDEESYQQYRPEWQATRDLLGLDVLPPTYEGFLMFLGLFDPSMPSE